MLAQVRPHVLTAEDEPALKPGDSFKECDKDCPEMVVVPAGEFIMGSPASEQGRRDDEEPQHTLRVWYTSVVRYPFLGFRVGRTLSTGADAITVAPGGR
jgi:hypothetical protein